MATQQQVNKLIDAISSAEEPESVTNEMVGIVLDHINKETVAQGVELRDLDERAGAAALSAADAKSKAADALDAAQSASAAAQSASSAAQSAADLAGIINTKVNDVDDSVTWLEQRLNAFMASSGNSIEFLPCDGQKSQEWLEDNGDPSDGVWLCPNLEGGWYFRCFGDTDWYGHSEEEYNSDMVYNPGYFYVVNNDIMRIENNKLKPVGSLVTSDDIDTIITPGVYIVDGAPLLVSSHYSPKQNLIYYYQNHFTSSGFVTRTGTANRPLSTAITPSPVWGEWEEFGAHEEPEPVEFIKSVKYAELKSLYDAGKLTPGMRYRIVDYDTYVVNDSSARSTFHRFDIIVRALDNSTLDAEAKAARNSGDSYFSRCDLGKWRIWYDINNDVKKYQWAATNGKGVIYRMIDEWGNDCPYDFKNVQFLRALVTGNLINSSNLVDGAGLYIGNTTGNYKVVTNGSSGVWRYTFSYLNKDTTVNLDSTVARHNFQNLGFGAEDVLKNENCKIAPYFCENETDDLTFRTRCLNNIVITSGEKGSDIEIAEGCYNITLSQSQSIRIGCGANRIIMHKADHVDIGAGSNLLVVDDSYGVTVKNDGTMSAVVTSTNVNIGRLASSIEIYSSDSINIGDGCSSIIIPESRFVRIGDYCANIYTTSNTQPMRTVTIGSNCNAIRLRANTPRITMVEVLPGTWFQSETDIFFQYSTVAYSYASLINGSTLKVWPIQ